MSKRFFLLTVFLAVYQLPQFLFAAPFEVDNQIERVMGYALDDSYTGNECVLYFSTAVPSSCPDKKRGVIKSGTEVGKLMCSMAITALMGGKSVTVASHDNCSANHTAPILRYIIINAN